MSQLPGRAAGAQDGRVVADARVLVEVDHDIVGTRLGPLPEMDHGAHHARLQDDHVAGAHVPDRQRCAGRSRQRAARYLHGRRSNQARLLEKVMPFYQLDALLIDTFV